jgi:hypothetical protein
MSLELIVSLEAGIATILNKKNHILVYLNLWIKKLIVNQK